MANQLGRRYRCDECGTVVLCTKAGEGTAQCHDKDMEVPGAEEAALLGLTRGW